MNTKESRAPGRMCPLHYRYEPKAFASAAAADLTNLDVLYVVGGLYGNVLALREVMRVFDQESGRKAMIFNGDFHWFDIDPDTFAEVQSKVLSFHAIRGNVETELADRTASENVGCGCAYPSWVDDAIVDRSNQILMRLKQDLTPTIQTQLGALPMWRRADVAGFKVAVVHGDATSLAGWGFAQEQLRETSHHQQVARWFEAAEVDAFASTHTCLPVFQAMANPSGPNSRWVFNNGAAGMSNFKGNQAGHFTRISQRPLIAGASNLGIQTGHVFVDLVAIETDQNVVQAQFLSQWPEGSDAHHSYYARLCAGPAYAEHQVIRHVS
jgi:hypothetical protein